MKLKLLFLSFLLIAFAAPAFLAQSVFVKPKKVFYTRKGKDIDKNKRTFYIIYPTISGTISPAAKKSLADIISYWRVFDIFAQRKSGRKLFKLARIQS